MKKESWIWVGGWGLPPDWLRKHAKRALPAADHTVVAPGPEAIAAIDWDCFDRAGGYSLGAFLLLKQAEMVALPAVLIAPFFAFAAEAGLGGKIRRAQVRYLSRWLQREPREALVDFYQRAGLDLGAPKQMPYSMDDLQWGLEQLANSRAPARLPENWTGFVGDRDPLFEANVLIAAEPRLRIVPSAGHHPAALMNAALEE